MRSDVYLCADHSSPTAFSGGARLKVQWCTRYRFAATGYVSTRNPCLLAEFFTLNIFVRVGMRVEECVWGDACVGMRA